MVHPCLLGHHQAQAHDPRQRVRRVVEAVGDGVTRFAVGDRVFGYDDARFGGDAEYLAIGQDAAAATEGSHYALSDIRAAGIDNRSEVLVFGATGAIGSAAVQIIKSLGAQVTAVCSGEHVELVAGLGADRVIDRTTTDFTTDTHRYDLFFDAVGKCSFRHCRKLLKPHGIWISTDLGPFSLNPLLVLATRSSRGRRVLFPLASINREIVNAYRYVENFGRPSTLLPLDEQSYQIVTQRYQTVLSDLPSWHPN